MQRAVYIEEPAVFIRHTARRSFIGPGLYKRESGDLLMAAPWGRPPTHFEQLAATFPVPMVYRSSDGGRTWRERGRLAMEWSLPGMISDGGISFLRLLDGRLAFLAHRHVQGLHGGGLPVISFSRDDGESWTPAAVVGQPEGVWYVMNDRLIQMAGGRLVVPVSHMPRGAGAQEGDRNLGLCFYSDDAGATWRPSRKPADLADARGMAEPCAAEVAVGRLLMLARTGSGRLYRSWSGDGGDSWSEPEPTTLPAACSPLTLKTLPDGRLIVFYNHAEPLGPGAFFPRTPLCYAVSADGGLTWGEPVLVDGAGAAQKDRQSIYPSVCFTGEGMVAVYSTHEADPQGSFAGQYSHERADCGGKRAILAYPG
jgi:sialidase-1